MHLEAVGTRSALTAQMERDGVELPADYVSKPTLPRGLLGYLEAFYDLDTERHHGMGFMRIPWSKIVVYATHYQMNVEETIYFIRRMDDAHIRQLTQGSSTDDKGTRGAREFVRRAPRPD